MNDGSRRPNSDTIVPALLGAVERLCADASPEKIGMRDVAAEAGLSVGVAYRYFDSKTALFGAALEQIGERLASATVASNNPRDAIAALWQALEDNPAFPRIATWVILDGRNPAQMMTKHPVARDVVRTAAAAGASDPRKVAAMTLLVGIAGAVFGEAINLATQREPHDRELYDTAADMLATWIVTQSS